MPVAYEGNDEELRGDTNTTLISSNPKMQRVNTNPRIGTLATLAAAGRQWERRHGSIKPKRALEDSAREGERMVTPVFACERCE